MRDAADLLADSVEMHCKDDMYMDIHAMVQAMTVQVVGTTAFGCAVGPSLSVTEADMPAAGKQDGVVRRIAPWHQAELSEIQRHPVLCCLVACCSRRCSVMPV